SQRRESATRPLQLVSQQRSRGTQRDVAPLEGEGARLAGRPSARPPLSPLDAHLATRPAVALGRIERLTTYQYLVLDWLEGYVDLCSISSNERFGKDASRLSFELRGVARVTGRKMGEHQSPHAGVARHLCRLARRRMPGLDRALGLLVPERRLVNQQV